MASSGKKKTTMGKLNRERKLRERRMDKQAKKAARKLASFDNPDEAGDDLQGDVGEPAGPDDEQPSVEPVAHSLSGA
jgi:hypothetical protein